MKCERPLARPKYSLALAGLACAMILGATSGAETLKPGRTGANQGFAAPAAPAPVRRIFGANNFTGWGAYAEARSLLAVNGDRLAQDETDVPAVLPLLAANGEYLTLTCNSYEPLLSLDSHRKDYANMVADQARTYGPGGSFWISHANIAQYAVQTFELMNEPYGWWYREGDNDPAAYARIAAAAIRAGRAANRKARFYLALAPTDVLLSNGEWIDWNAALLAAAPNLFQLADGFSIHLYYSPAEAAPLLDRVKEWAWAQRGGNGKPFIITESNLPDAAPEQEFVDAMPQFVQLADSRRTWVHELFIFCWHGYPDNDFFGFVSEDGIVRQDRADSYRDAVEAALGY